MPNDTLTDNTKTNTYRRVELITGETRRRRWRDEEKAQIVAESLQPGARVTEVARRHGVNRNQVWSWRRLARQMGGAKAIAGFVPVRVAGSAAQATLPRLPEKPEAPEPVPASMDGRLSAGTIELETGRLRIRICGAVDQAALQQVLLQLHRAP